LSYSPIFGRLALKHGVNCRALLTLRWWA